VTRRQPGEDRVIERDPVEVRIEVGDVVRICGTERAREDETVRSCIAGQDVAARASVDDGFAALAEPA
jgi:hypothetical protein